MENLQKLDFCQWLSEPIALKVFKEEYFKVLDDVEGNDGKKKSFKEFLKLHRKPADGSSKNENGGFSFDLPEISDAEIDEMQRNCSASLLDDDEQGAQQHLLNGPTRLQSNITSYYIGSYSDGIIPEEALPKLECLKAQKEELEKRLKNTRYMKMRSRLFKYSSTVRFNTDENNIPIPLKDLKEDGQRLREIVLNIRIQRPFHRKTHYKKASNRYPAHSQEFLMLGSQKISELKDNIKCVNDLSPNQNMADNPDSSIVKKLPTSAERFPSGFLYINGTFYNDLRHKEAKNYSKEIREWAKRYPEIGELKTADMCDVTLEELIIRVGYPYVYFHRGYCEHLVTITDVRLHDRSDVLDSKKYPVARGQATRQAVTCNACGLYLANWIVKGQKTVPIKDPHFCTECMKLYCYDGNGKPIEDIRVFPFFDEVVCHKEKLAKK